MGMNPPLEQIEALDSLVLRQMWGIKPKILHDIQAEAPPREQTKSKKLFSEAALRSCSNMSFEDVYRRECQLL